MLRHGVAEVISLSRTGDAKGRLMVGTGGAIHVIEISRSVTRAPGSGGTQAQLSAPVVPLGPFELAYLRLLLGKSRARGGGVLRHRYAEAVFVERDKL